MTMPPILLLADARPSAGYGHLGRSTSLKRALEREGAVCTLASDDPIAAAEASKAHIVVIDGYGWPERYAGPLRDRGCKIVVIDDDGLPALPVDLVINVNAHAKADLYRAPSLIGPRYGLIRSEFESLRQLPRAYDVVRSAFICMGGSDPDAVTPKAVEGMLESLGSRSETVLTIVLGPMCHDRVEGTVADVLGRFECDARILRAPPDFPSLLAAADLALLSGGGVLTEAIHLGVPSIALVLAHNQRANVSAWVRMGAVVEALPRADAITRVAGDLLADATRRRRTGETARALVDGRGAERAAQAIIALCHPADRS